MLRASAAEHLGRALLFTGTPAESAAVARAVAAELPAELADLRRALRGGRARRPRSSAPATSRRCAIEPPATTSRRASARRCSPRRSPIERAYSARAGRRVRRARAARTRGGELIAADNGGFFTMASIIALVAGEHDADVTRSGRRRARTRTAAARCSRPARSTSGTATRCYPRGELADAAGGARDGVDEFEGWGYGSRAERLRADASSPLTLLELGDVAEARACARARRRAARLRRRRRPLLARHARSRCELAEGRAEDAVATAERVARALPRRAEPGRQPVARARGGGATTGSATASEALALAERGGRAGAPLGRARARSAARCACSARSSARTASTHLQRGRRGARRLAARGSSTRRRWRRSARRCGRSRQPTDAREPLRRALELADACGADARSPRTSAPSSTRRARGPRSTAASGVGSLTAERAPRRRPRRRGPDEPRHRPDALRHAEDGRGAPQQRLPQARDQLAPRARDRSAPNRTRSRGSPRKTGVELGGRLDAPAAPSPILATWTTRP